VATTQALLPKSQSGGGVLPLARTKDRDGTSTLVLHPVACAAFGLPNLGCFQPLAHEGNVAPEQVKLIPERSRHLEVVDALLDSVEALE